MRSLSPLLLAAAVIGAAEAAIVDWVSPKYTNLFEFELPIPPVLAPSASYTNTTTGKTIDFYEITIKAFEKQVYPNLGKTSFVGYNGIAPGPTLKTTKGREAVVRFVNTYEKPSSIHLHGSYSRTPFDGWAEDVTKTGEYKDYYYPNQQAARTLWYHDHAVHITSINAYFGQVGFYYLEDPAVTQQLGLPTGDYDIPLMLDSKVFGADGKLISPETQKENLWGDVNMVNGQPWPFIKVENRKYKFRLLDASVSRSYSLFLSEDSAPTVKIPFTVVGADAGLLDHPVDTETLDIAQAERYEIIIDFDKYKGKNLTLMNAPGVQQQVEYPETARVLRFVVDKDVSSQVGNGPIPAKLTELELPAAHTTVDKSFTFGRQGAGQTIKWTINNVGFSDPASRVLAFPEQGLVQRWKLVNNGGGWTHPIHIHLVDFQVISRTSTISGRVVQPYEAAALKDVVYLGRGETVEVLANFAPWSGLYMFHCHNLIHEDNDMMAAFNVSGVDLSALGYPQTVNFDDPMAPMFRAKPYTGTDLDQVRDVLLPGFANLEAYPDVKAFETALEEYHKAHPKPAARGVSTLVTSVKAAAPTAS